MFAFHFSLHLTMRSKSVYLSPLEQFVSQARRIKSVGWVGRRMSPHCTAAGKILLAYLPQRELDQFLQGGLEQFTPHTITDPHKLQKELVQAREQGYALAREELEKGLNVVAAPIYDHTGQVVASASVAGPAYRVTPERFPELAAQLMDMTTRISERLGHKRS
jgi:IclR family acetate operon transcriptional repressor